MDEDPRFSFKPTKSGKPGYLQPYKGNEKKLKPFGSTEAPQGYVVVTPTFTFDVLGKPATSASELRKQFITLDNKTQKDFIKDLFGKYDATVHKTMDEKLKAMMGKSVKQLREEITHKKFGPMLDSFVSFASEKLGLETMPKVRFKDESDDYNSFAAYNPSNHELSVHTKNRHPMDVFRSVAHELVHHKQKEEDRIGKDIAKEGETGSDIENEANSEAGKIMRWFAKENPDMFKQTHIVEETLHEGLNDYGKLKAIFLAGGPGSGKDFVMNSILKGDGLKEINSDTAFEFLMKKNGLDMEMPEEERLERDIVRGRAKGITKDKERLALAGRLGLIINSTADDIEKLKAIKQNLEASGYETMMVFVNTSDEVSRQRNVERGKLGNRKVPDGTNKEGVPDGSPDIRREKWEAAQHNIGELQKVFGNQGFAVIDNSIDIRKATPQVKAKVQDSFDRVRRMAQQFVKAPNKNPAAKQWTDAEIQKRGVTDYQEPKRGKPLSQIRNTTQKAPSAIPPVIHKPDNELMAHARRLGLKYYGFGRFGRQINGENRVMFHSKGGQLLRIQPVQQQMNEDPCWKGYQAIGMKKKKGKKVPNCVPVDEAFEQFVEEHGAGDEGTDKLRKNYEKVTPRQPVRKKIVAQEDNLPLKSVFPNLPVADGVGPEIDIQKQIIAAYPISESIQSWIDNDKTRQKFAQKYGNLWEEKLLETAMILEKSGCGAENFGPKSLKELKEAKAAAWTRKEGKSESGGLNRKGVESYRRENPGSKLSTAVTTKPSKLKKGSKAANRRKSFCARMGGMKKRLTSAKTAKDPNSRINKSLRKWNCE
jgi:hypothetical protein